MVHYNIQYSKIFCNCNKEIAQKVIMINMELIDSFIIPSYKHTIKFYFFSLILSYAIVLISTSFLCFYWDLIFESMLWRYHTLFPIPFKKYLIWSHLIIYWLITILEPFLQWVSSYALWLFWNWLFFLWLLWIN